MNALPFPLGTLHFVGIGGIGMSGIAEVLHNQGYRVQGSDLADSANVQRLKKLGIPVHIGHAAENLQTAADGGMASIVVVSSAVKKDNPEVTAARAAQIPIVRRAEMLAEIMRLKWSIAIGGTHGKTTTTSLVGCLLEGGGLDPTIINGGILNAYGTNTRMGEGEWLVAEADESDGTFIRLPATIAVITNIDPEHMDYYASFDDIKAAFRQFIDNLPFYGFAVACCDHPTVRALIPTIPDRRIIAYGTSEDADIRALNLRPGAKGYHFDVAVSPRLRTAVREIRDMSIPLFGEHNVRNALAAIAIGLELGIAPETIRKSLAGFAGVKRRFTVTGITGGVTVIDDYGHHPVEIEAVLKAGRTALDHSTKGRLIAVVQPHRYTRLQALFDGFCQCFALAQTVIVADVYAAGEKPIAGFDRDALVEGIRRHGHKDVIALPDPSKLAATVQAIATPGDMVICLGAGNITQWAHALPGELEALAQTLPKRAKAAAAGGSGSASAADAA